jgi:hypothetical protein
MFKFALIIYLFLFSLVSADDKQWIVEKNKNITTVSMNGDVQHGDVLMFWLKKEDGKCDTVSHSFTFYTAKNNPNIEILKDKIIPINIKGEAYNDGNVYAQISYLSEFLMGHRIYFSIGVYNIDEHINYLSTHKSFDVTIADDHYPNKEIDNSIKHFKADDYFDIKNNSWSLNGLKEAIKEGQKLCLS